MKPTTMRDPTAETASELRARRAPPESLEGITVALMDIGKMRGDEFIDRLEVLLRERGISTRRYKKPTNTRTAPIELLQKIAAECQVVAIALSDCGSCTSCSTHDLVDLDRRGLAGVSILTEEFREPFAQQCKAIGFDGASVYVPHPMQTRTTAELHRFADDVVEQVLGKMGEQHGILHPH
ncbi:MAG: UGSC family (seleno)protein [Usitatibacter sp.]